MNGILTIVGLIAMVLLGGSGGSLFGGTGNNGTGTGQTYQGAEACRPTVNKDRMLKVQINSTTPDLRPVYASPTTPGGNKEEKTWVLVKENAPIPAWKVELLSRAGAMPRSIYDPKIGEMERIGISIPYPDGSNNPDAKNKEVYLGVGWCNPETRDPYLVEGEQVPGCLDPLVQDVVFVVVQKGATIDSLSPNGDNGWLTDFGWGQGTSDASIYQAHPRNQENFDLYYWEFNVYYDASKLPADPTYENLPDWMKLQCPNGGDIMGENRCQEDPECQAALSQIQSLSTLADARSDNKVPLPYRSVLAASSSELCSGVTNGTPCLIINRSYIDITTTPSQPLAEEYVAIRKVEKPTEPPYEDIGTAYTNHFRVLYKESTIVGTTASHILVLDPIGHPEGPWYEFAPNTFSEYQLGNSLQLGSFTPGIPSFYYEWWTPSCKPAIYLYPEKETSLTVAVKPNGYITESIPPHNFGWQIMAKPDGTITNMLDAKAQKHYPYLYYEAAIMNIAISKDRGWIKTNDQLLSFFHETLPKVGLNEKERRDFMDYWIPKLSGEGNRWFITLVDRGELDRVEPINFSTIPDTFIRVRFYFENIDSNPLQKWISEYQLPAKAPLRQGFTAVDWGGIVGGGSCKVSVISQ